MGRRFVGGVDVVGLVRHDAIGVKAAIDINVARVKLVVDRPDVGDCFRAFRCCVQKLD